MRLRRTIPTILAVAGVTTLTLAGSAFGNDGLPGRFTGGGRFYSAAGVKMTHGFELHCNVADDPNNLEVNWGGNRWHLENLTWASCSNRDNADASPPAAQPVVYNGHGYGRYNGVSGYYAHWRITDEGEPGTKDRMHITIWDPSNSVVVQTSGGDGSLLDQGNHQSHKV